MNKNLSSGFDERQRMINEDIEVYYYCDVAPFQVLSHSHCHYEIYFFLEGEASYQVDGRQYELKPGDFLLIPPNKPHCPRIAEASVHYRRIIFWISCDFYDKLCKNCVDFSYGFDFSLKNQCFHFRTDLFASRSLHGYLMELMEELQRKRIFQRINSHIMAAGFLAAVNRIIYESVNTQQPESDIPLYLRLCDYINAHLTSPLTLEALSEAFYLNKYHISHAFRENMGISLHRYIVKKKLAAVKNGLLSGLSPTGLAAEYGFQDYTGFYRAFKKEFGLSPGKFCRHNKNKQDS